MTKGGRIIKNHEIISEYAVQILIENRQNLVYQNIVEIENGIIIYFLQQESQELDEVALEYIKTKEPTNVYLEILKNGYFKLGVVDEWYKFQTTFDVNVINKIIELLNEEKE